MFYFFQKLPKMPFELKYSSRHSPAGLPISFVVLKISIQTAEPALPEIAFVIAVTKVDIG